MKKDRQHFKTKSGPKKWTFFQRSNTKSAELTLFFSRWFLDGICSLGIYCIIATRPMFQAIDLYFSLSGKA
jgi:hypothetical protein